MSEPESLSFSQHYTRLKQIAEILRQQQEPDIDALIPLIDEATAAYKACRSRIDTVRELFDLRKSEYESRDA
ncbi:MAG: hypothetical protein RIQ52_1715 [Pseudomonadota bacterium]|jgi:exodeoxyribonuclease VII small subunit